MTNSVKNQYLTCKLGKILQITLILFLSLGYSQAQILKIFNKKGKNSEPIFEIEGRTPSQPSTLSIQDKYVGKIMFSDQQLTMANTAENLFKSSFNFGDPIYARVFTSNAVENYMLYSTQEDQPQGATENMRYSYTIYYSIDSVNILTWRQENNDNLRGVNTWQRFVMLDPSSSKSYDWDHEKQREALNKLAPGIHKVKVEIWAGEGKELASIKPIAAGEFDLNVSEGNSKIKIGKSWNDIKNGSMASDEKIKSTLISLTADDLKATQPDVTIKEYKITSNGYGVQKNDYGLPKFRFVQVAAYAVGNKSGKCFVFYTLFAQDYMGAGSYSANFYKWGNPNVVEVDCE